MLPPPLTRHVFLLTIGSPEKKMPSVDGYCLVILPRRRMQWVYYGMLDILARSDTVLQILLCRNTAIGRLAYALPSYDSLRDIMQAVE